MSTSDRDARDAPVTSVQPPTCAIPSVLSSPRGARNTSILWVPKTVSPECDLGVFVDQPAEPVSAE